MGIYRAVFYLRHQKMQATANLKKILVISLVAIISITLWIIADLVFPRTPQDMTVINQQQRLFSSTCPVLSEPLLTANSLPLPATFSLLNWNIYKQQNTQWLRQITKWVKQVDLVTLQEAKYDQKLMQFSEDQQLFTLQNVAFEYQQINYGVNTLSRSQPQQLCGSRYIEPWSRIPKSAIASTYQITGSTEPLLVVNLHGVNFTLTATPLIEQLSPLISLIETHKGPVIVTGDFNTWSEARTLAVDKALTALALDEVSFTTDNRLMILGKPLDHVFYKGLTVTNARSIPTIASDHTPQLVTFSRL